MISVLFARTDSNDCNFSDLRDLVFLLNDHTKPKRHVRMVLRQPGLEADHVVIWEGQEEASDEALIAAMNI
jgi:hypothetical protein